MPLTRHLPMMPLPERAGLTVTGPDATPTHDCSRGVSGGTRRWIRAWTCSSAPLRSRLLEAEVAKVYVDKLATGDHGEALVMAQLRQRGWAVENLNRRKRNHPVFDIRAEKDAREVWINAKMNSLD